MWIRLSVFPLKIKSTQWINFSRITLVHKKAKERLTIDLNLKLP